MLTLDALDFDIRDLDCDEDAEFPSDYDGKIKLFIEGDRGWFNKIIGFKVYLNGTEIFKGIPIFCVEIPFAKIEGTVNLKIISFCPTCKRKTFEQQLRGEVF